MRKFKISLIFLLTMMLIGCSSQDTADGRYQIENDHRPDNPPPLGHVEDVNPRYEPYSLGGNKDYTVRGIDYRVLTGITKLSERGIASWYGNKFHGHLTSNGERYDMFAMTAAHKNLPLPSYVRVINLENNKRIVVRVNDRGPFHEGRIIDLSYAAAYKLDILKTGTAKVEIQLLHFPVQEDLSNQFNGDYYIQYLVTYSADKANDLGKKYRAEYQVKSLFIEEDELYKLRLGPFNSQLRAEKILAEIKNGYPQAFIVHKK
ncbi:rare lipoprotein A [Psychromonas ingrahamii 37]|uniref:Endolytic peptidoglycan transglycosylase RlpA n=1 Tax=Psychromonas ingrahamii (strain DSM 17664 / CCUG 51855 / 37) TaxID=357804 RepID=A1SU05_PSYIN|nr:septal ring lytic transglycosylase RlpA family protein [Psychromonas ingrahamii]ABM02970.1 rare lipoprotein A [Psychromonas ingrahamii 37]